MGTSMGRAAAAAIVAAVAGVAFALEPPVGAARAIARAWSDTVSAEQVARGDSVFHGKAGGGTCFACHQMNAKGLPGLAPDLTDASWLHGDGSLTFIKRTVTAGVAKPKQSAAPMLPMGGAKLSTDDVDAVAAYVWTLSR